jgi:hypothetical protein
MAQRKKRDPKEQGASSHPLGSVGGVAAGAAAGAISGVAAGPVGSLAGAVGGAALAGAATAAGTPTAARDSDSVQPPLTDQQRREAMDFGAQTHRRLGRGAEWSDAEPTLRSHWSSAARSRPSWEQARSAVHEGWKREG